LFIVKKKELFEITERIYKAIKQKEKEKMLSKLSVYPKKSSGLNDVLV
jgi:hypothetical protein